ncbi:hypothetical protein EJP81_25140 (plasmid) [Rahnella aquatilis]|jgi:uncharacterized protein YqfA (UPF0365 family)|nr:hypothetical protein EYS10_02205 [Rahnella aquatilis]QEU49889.1 hypothetical protein EJP80_25515 [Rahnella aquatilis]QEU50912.1 hypothetical protein EJP79_25140 [Rahnella aquatilis]QEU51937.1 hypothetical protein EJP81_25140 [Rahnella aquatilis]
MVTGKHRTPVLLFISSLFAGAGMGRGQLGGLALIMVISLSVCASMFIASKAKRTLNIQRIKLCNLPGSVRKVS